MSVGKIYNYDIWFGSKQIKFCLEFSKRKTLGITVTPDMNVLVKAPVDASLEKIKEKVRKKAPWILKQQSYFLNFLPRTPERKFISGETHLYLGRQYQLNVMNNELKEMNNPNEHSSSNIPNSSPTIHDSSLIIHHSSFIIEHSPLKEHVKLSGKFLNVYTNDKTRAKILVENWYLQKAKERLPKIAEPLIEKFLAKHQLKIDKSSLLTLRKMRARWGSCTPKNKIILNPELIKAPKGCIEYVITHELCHLIHHNHTQKFIDLQTKEMPNWEKWKEKLESLLA